MTWIDQVNYSFIDQRPRAYRDRNGKLGPEMRTREHWRIALQGHTETAHGGKVDGACPACRELSAKVASKGMP